MMERTEVIEVRLVFFTCLAMLRTNVIRVELDRREVTRLLETTLFQALCFVFRDDDVNLLGDREVAV